MFILSLFVLVALAATIFGYLYAPVPMHGQEYLGRAIRAWATLFGGLAFFLTVVGMNQSEEDLRFTLKWLYIGLAASIVWGGIQFVSYLTDFPGRGFLNQIQRAFSVRQLLVKERVAGFAYEPSWLANQLATVYLPWLWISVLAGYRVFRRRWIEPVLLLGATFLLITTFSRGGILMALGSGLLGFVFTQRELLKSVLVWFREPFQKRVSSAIGLRVGIVLALVVGLTVAGYLLSQNKYFSRLWSSNKTTLVDYVVDISAGPRLAYAAAGWGIYETHPWTGVGLGASGFYLYDHIPDWSMTTLSEITRQLTPQAWLYPNIKNMHIRVLAETGLIGFGLYLIFWLVLLGQILDVLRRKDPWSRLIGGAGLTTWIVLMFFHFTQDSFIDPNGWWGIGLFIGLSGVILDNKSVNSHSKFSS
jgi:O-antigen ligase